MNTSSPSLLSPPSWKFLASTIVHVTLSFFLMSASGCPNDPPTPEAPEKSSPTSEQTDGDEVLVHYYNQIILKEPI